MVGGRWLNNRNLVGGRCFNKRNLVGGWLLFWSVIGFFTAISRWSWFFRSVVGGSFGRWSMVGYFLGKWSVVGGRWSVVGGWSVGGGFVLRPCLRICTGDYKAQGQGPT